VRVAVVAVMTVMMAPGGKYRTCERHQKQYCREFLDHGTNPSTGLI